jgi:hypothetical protein
MKAKTCYEIKEQLRSVKREIKTSLENIIGIQKLKLKRPIIVSQQDGMVSSIICIDSELNVTTEVESIEDSWRDTFNIDFYPIHIQIKILEELEKKRFEVNNK